MMQLTFIWIVIGLMSYKAKYKIDFGKATGGQEWEIVNDGVMGGWSQSKALITENSLVFKGEISLKNNGGFASVRSPVSEIDLSNYHTVTIKFRSTGRDFALRLATSELYYKPNYKHFFSSKTGAWEIVELKMSDFKQYTMGQISDSKMDKKKLENVLSIGIILSDKKEGPFALEVDYILFN